MPKKALKKIFSKTVDVPVNNVYKVTAKNEGTKVDDVAGADVAVGVDKVDKVAAKNEDDVAGAVPTVGVDKGQELKELNPIQIGDVGTSEKAELMDNETVENGVNDDRLTEDSEKDEFVDCPDDLIVPDNRDALTIEKTERSTEDDFRKDYVNKLYNGTHNEAPMHGPMEYKDVNESVFQDFYNLHHQLKVLSNQQPLSNENGEEVGENLSILETANECFKLVKYTLDERLRMEEKLKKLQSSIVAKDEEMDYLHAKVSELSMSQNVVHNYFNSQNLSLSDPSNPLIEVQFGLQSIDDSVNRLLASLAMTVNAEGLTDESLTGRMLFVEHNVSQLTGNYQYLLSEIELLRQSLTEVSSDFNAQEDFWTTTAVARNVLLELKRKEVDSGQHVSNLEEENKKINADIEKLRVELEQEKIRYANSKEKLSMAVTKGKALVQQRDSLKQSLAEKTREIEKCLAEIEEKSQALDAAAFVKDELVRTENLAALLQETIYQKDNILSRCEEILYQTSLNHELESVDIMEKIRCLVDEKNTMEGVIVEFDKLQDVLSSVDFPENVSSSDLESRISYLVESFFLAKGEVEKLKDEITRSIEVAHDEVERLTVSLLAETQEKLFIREELEGLTHKYQEIVQKESQLSMEKDRIVSLLLEASGTATDGQEESDQFDSDMGSLIDRCFAKIKEQSNASHGSSGLDADLFERMQTQLYLTNQKLVVCEELLQEDAEIKAKMNTLVDELGTLSQELQVLKDEKTSLVRDLERSDEKTSLLREKLSTAVKKGKGLVQDRENLKKLMAEKTAEIENLNLALEQRETMVNDFKNQISKLSMDVELILKLEADLTKLKDQKDQLEQFLAESNSMIQTVMETVDSAVVSANVTFQEPVDKVLWLVRYLNECQDAKTVVDQELENRKVDFDSLSSKLSEAYAAKSLLEDALSNAENNISQLSEVKRELAETCGMRKSLEDALAESEKKILMLSNEKDESQICKADLETQLEKVKEALSSTENIISHLREENRELSETCGTSKSLEDALAEAENKILMLSNERDETQLFKADIETQLERVKEELAETCGMRKSLEDALTEAENKILLLNNEKDEAQICKSDLETQLEKVKEALSRSENIISQLSEEKRELTESCGTSKSLEDALAEAENKILMLSNERDEAQLFKADIETQFERVKEELAETCGMRKSLDEDALAEVENKILLLNNEKNEAQICKSDLETQLEKVKEALSRSKNIISQLSEEKRELAESCGTSKSLEDALAEAENKILMLSNEKKEAELYKADVEAQLEKVKEEVSTQTTRLSEAYRNINSLEDALSHLETNVSLLSKENNDAQVDRSNLEGEMKKLKEEAESQASKFSDATLTMRSLEENLSKLVGEKKNAEEEISILKQEAESQSSKFLDITSTIRSLEDNLSTLVDGKKVAEEEISVLRKEAEFQANKLVDATSTIRSLEYNLSKLVDEKNNAEEEILLLNSKLSACMEEFAGLGGNLENRSQELSSHLNTLQLLLKDDTLSSLIKQSLEAKFQSLRDMDLLLRDINRHLVQLGSDSLLTSAGNEEDSVVDKFSADFDNVANVEIDKGDYSLGGNDSFESYFRKTVEGILSKNRFLADKVQGYSAIMDKFSTALLKNMQATRDEVVCKLDKVTSLEQKANDLETGREAHELKIASLENDVKVLSFACTMTTQELQNEALNCGHGLSSIPERESWTNLLSEVRGNTTAIPKHDNDTHLKPVEDLLVAAQKICGLTMLLEREKNISADAIQVLENKMTGIQATTEKTSKERDLLQARMSKLEIELEVLQSSHQELSFKLQDYQAIDSTLSNREAEISSLRESLTIKEKEAEDALLVASQVKSLHDKINDLEIPFKELNMRDTEFHDSDHLKKLFYVVDAVTSMQRQVNTLTQDKEKLQISVEKQAHQMEALEEEIEKKRRENEKLENIKNEIIEVELGMENIIYKLGGNDLVGNHKSAGLRGLFSVLEKLVAATVLEYDSSKFKIQELIVKLHGSQKVVEELSAKVKLLEASSGRSSSSDGIKERSIFEAPSLPVRTEITELEDAGTLGKKVAGQSPSAAHARSLHKESNDHLAINIDSESDRLIKNEESDEDKGKVFKSLNTSGLVPRQGKPFADRIDGYWVNGDRALMSRPRARLGLIAYWLLLHIWLLGTIL